LTYDIFKTALEMKTKVKVVHLLNWNICLALPTNIVSKCIQNFLWCSMWVDVLTQF